MLFWLLDGELMLLPETTTLSRTLGALIGENKVTLELASKMDLVFVVSKVSQLIQKLIERNKLSNFGKIKF